MAEVKQRCCDFMRKIVYFISVMVISLSIGVISASAYTFKVYDVPNYLVTYAERQLFFSYSSFLDYYVIGRTVFENDNQLRVCFLNDNAVDTTDHKNGSGDGFTVSRSSFEGKTTAECYVFEKDSSGNYTSYSSSSGWSNLSFFGSYVTNYHDKKSSSDSSSSGDHNVSSGITLEELKPYFFVITISILLIFLAIEFKRRR